MSIHAMNQVWQHFCRGGSEKLVLLALADWCDDQGGSLHPSIGRVAKKVCVSESQARRIMHGFIEEGLLEVEANHFGGAKTQTRHYRLRLDLITATPSTNATPRTDATPSTDARDPLHGCALPLAPMTPNTSITIKEPSVGTPPVKQRKKKAQETLQTFLDRCAVDGEDPIPLEDPIFAYAKDVRLTDRMLELSWFVFKERYLQAEKKQADWRAHYRNAVKRNWYRLWFFEKDGGAAALTTAGTQADRELQAEEGRQ